MGTWTREDRIKRDPELSSNEVTQAEVGCVAPLLPAIHSNSTPHKTASKFTFLHKVRIQHSRLPGLRRIPFPAISIIVLIALINVVIWIFIGVILHFHASLISTAILSYTLGLRHALDADHISAIDLMTRRLIASGQRPVTVGTYFSLGHSTIVVITSFVVAATAAVVSGRFHSLGTIGAIVGSAVSAGFLLLLGAMNIYILFRLIKQMKNALNLRDGEEEQAWRIEGSGCLFNAFKKMFRIIDKPWKMYPLGVMFGLGFDTSSEIALLGISSIQAANGTSMWLILIFPVLFTAGMCLVDTMDGALMLTLYVLPAERFVGGYTETAPPLIEREDECEHEEGQQMTESQASDRVKDPVAFLYYSIVLTSLTVMVALIIGTIQLLTLFLNVASPSGPFWDGVQTAGDHYEVIGGAVCASFVIFGGISVLCYKPWRLRIEKARKKRFHVPEAQQSSESARIERPKVIRDDDRTMTSHVAATSLI